MSPSLINSAMNSVRSFRSVPVRILVALAAMVILLAALVGCGGGGEKDTVLATVGKEEIKASYYEDRLVRLEENELPRSEEGDPLDMSLQEGKEKFLEILINKEIMVQTAKNMGLGNDPNIVNAQEALSSYEASLIMWNRVIAEPGNTISPEELDDFYSKMRSSRASARAFVSSACSTRSTATMRSSEPLRSLLW